MLGLNHALGRLQEELWLILAPTDLWKEVGEGQDASKEVLAVMASDMEFGAVREMWLLPLGHVWADRKEAFDRTWRGDFLAQNFIVQKKDQEGILETRRLLCQRFFAATRVPTR